MFVFSIYLVVINFLFLVLGALLYLYAGSIGIEVPGRTDLLYPQIAFNHLNTAAGIFFILGLIGSTYASSDSALTALTTSFCVDFLNFEKGKSVEGQFAYEEDRIAYFQKIEAAQRKKRSMVHLSFSLAFVVIILILNALSNDAVINLIFKIAGYTYGPLLGLFMFGLFTNLKLQDRFVPVVCVAAPFLTWAIELSCKSWLDVGFLTILINGIITACGLWAISFRDVTTETQRSME